MSELSLPKLARQITWPLAACLLLLFATAWPFLRSLVALFSSGGDYSHGFLVPLVSAYSAWVIVEDHGSSPAARSWLWAGLPVAGLGTAVAMFSYWYAAGLNPGGTGWLFLGATGLLGVLAGLILATAGEVWLKRLAFPLAYLLFALPLPASILTKITLRLRTLGSILTTWLLRLSGVEVTRDGNVLHTAGGMVGIIDACSGIRSLWVLTAAAVAILHFGRFTWRRGLLLLASVPVLAVAGNLIRLYVSALLISRGQHDIAEGSAHELLGLITFVLALGGLIGCSRLLAGPRRREEGGPSPAEMPDQARAASTRAPLLAILALLALATGLRATITRHYAVDEEAEFLAGAQRRALVKLPRQLGDFRLAGMGQFSAEELEELRPSDHTIAHYVNQRGQRIEAQFSYWQPQNLASMGAFRHPHWPDTCYPSQGWTSVPELDTEKAYDWLPGETPRWRAFRKRAGEGKTAVVILAAWRSRADPRRLFVPSQWGQRLRALVDSWWRKKRRVRSQYGVTLRVFLDQTMPTPDDGLRVIEEFGKSLAPHLPTFGLSREQVDRDRAIGAAQPGD